MQIFSTFSGLQLHDYRSNILAIVYKITFRLFNNISFNLINTIKKII